MLKKIVLMGFAFLCLTGCHRASDVRYLVRHPWVLQRMAAECSALDEAALSRHSSCERVLYVYHTAPDLSHQLISDQPGFGRKILVSQTELIGLNEKIAKETNQEKRAVLVKQRILLQHKIDTMLALVGEFEGF